MKGDIVFTTTPQILEAYGNYKNRENYDDQNMTVEEWVLFAFSILFFIIWIFALFLLFSAIQRARSKNIKIPYMFVIFLLFLMFYMPLFGTIVFFVVVYPEIREKV